MTDLTHLPFVAAMAQAGQGSGNILVQIFPFALMLGIFYLLVLMPMRKRQKKVQDFQGALKVGDRVITTGGLYGQITGLTEQAITLEIADKIRVKVARNGIAGPAQESAAVEAKASKE
jgi:preprotein translocase subunit YajC